MAANQFAPPVLAHMWTQVLPIAELQRIDRENRKIMVENAAKHLLASKELLYLPRNVGGRARAEVIRIRTQGMKLELRNPKKMR